MAPRCGDVASSGGAGARALNFGRPYAPRTPFSTARPSASVAFAASAARGWATSGDSAAISAARRGSSCRAVCCRGHGCCSPVSGQSCSPLARGTRASARRRAAPGPTRTHVGLRVAMSVVPIGDPLQNGAEPAERMPQTRRLPRRGRCCGWLRARVAICGQIICRPSGSPRPCPRRPRRLSRSRDAEHRRRRAPAQAGGGPHAEEEPPSSPVRVRAAVRARTSRSRAPPRAWARAGRPQVRAAPVHAQPGPQRAARRAEAALHFAVPPQRAQSGRPRVRDVASLRVGASHRRLHPPAPPRSAPQRLSERSTRALRATVAACSRRARWT